MDFSQIPSICLSFSPSFLSLKGGGGGGSGGMIKKTRDDAVFVTGIALDATFENIRDVFSSVGNIKVSMIETHLDILVGLR